MKRIVLPVMLAALAACSKPTSNVETPATSEAQVSESSPSTEPTAPSEQPVGAPEKEQIAAATPPPKQLAPDGIYFLRVATRIETDAGVLGVKRGAQLTKVDEQTFKTAQGDLVKLSSDQVTNDLNEVRQILAQEQKSAAATANWQAQAAKAEQARQQAANEAAARTAAEQERAARTAPAAQRRSTPMASTSSLSAPQPARNVMATPSSNIGVQHSAQKRVGNDIYRKDVNGNWVWHRSIR